MPSKSWLNSPEFIAASRMATFLGTLLAAVAGIIFMDMRADVKASRDMLVQLSGTVRVHEQIVVDHGRRLDRAEARLFLRSSIPPSPGQ